MTHSTAEWPAPSWKTLHSALSDPIVLGRLWEYMIGGRRADMVYYLRILVGTSRALGGQSGDSRESASEPRLDSCTLQEYMRSRLECGVHAEAGVEDFFRVAEVAEFRRDGEEAVGPWLLRIASFVRSNASKACKRRCGRMELGLQAGDGDARTNEATREGKINEKTDPTFGYVESVDEAVARAEECESTRALLRAFWLHESSLPSVLNEQISLEASEAVSLWYSPPDAAADSSSAAQGDASEASNALPADSCNAPGSDLPPVKQLGLESIRQSQLQVHERVAAFAQGGRLRRHGPVPTQVGPRAKRADLALWMGKGLGWRTWAILEVAPEWRTPNGVNVRWKEWRKRYADWAKRSN